MLAHLEVLSVFFLLFFSIGILSFRCQHYRRRQQRLCVLQNQQCIQELKIDRWGLFESAQVNLTGRPLFAVITGETGSGKSVLISALEYLCQGSSKRSLFRQGSESSVSLRLADHDEEDLQKQQNQVDMRRSYSAQSRRSSCEINGQKVTSKMLTKQLEGTVRFWSADSINLLDTSASSSSSSSSSSSEVSSSPGFLTYIDALLGAEGAQLQRQVSDAYTTWYQQHKDLYRLLFLQRRMEQGNEVQLLTHFSQEVGGLETRLLKAFADLLSVAEDLEEATLIESSSTMNSEEMFEAEQETGEEEEEEEEEAAKGGTSSFLTGKKKVESSTSPMEELLVILRETVPIKGKSAALGLDLRKAWRAIQLSNTLLTGLSRALAASFPSTGSSSSSSSSSSSAVSSFSSSSSSSFNGQPSDGRIEHVEEALEDYADRLLTLQKGFKSIGLQGTAIDNKLERAHVALQEARKSLRGAQAVLNELQQVIPDIGPVMNKLALIKTEWETLSRKHGVQPPELEKLKASWSDDIASMSTLLAELPAQRLAEEAEKKKYANAAMRLSALRAAAASQLAERVNALLPSLEMGDKWLAIQLRVSVNAPAGGDLLLSSSLGGRGGVKTRKIVFTATDILSSSAEQQSKNINLLLPHLDPTSNKINAHGWDTIRLAISMRHDALANEKGQQEDLENERAEEEEEENDKDEEEEEEEEEVEDDDALPASFVLSSGESARLSLALETCCLGDGVWTPFSPNSNQEVESQGGVAKKEGMFREGLVVYDEIDAHVGGEAAVAVARLLRAQGRRRQVLAITHNPVIAAAADKHYVVTRTLPQASTLPLSPSSSSSPTPLWSTNVGSSVVRQVEGEHREEELARMATGRLNTDAGNNLAKALLDIFS